MGKTSKVRLLGFIVASIVVVVVFVILMITGEERPLGLRIGYVPFSGDLPVFVALEKGFFQKEGLKVEAIRCGYKELTDALLSGRIDIAGPTALPVFFAIEAESPGLLKFFLAGGEKIGGDLIGAILVPKDSPLQTIDGLRGKKLGVHTGHSSLLYAKLVLKGAGLEPQKDVTIIQIDSKLAPQALASGQFDALLTTEPYVSIAITKIGARVLVENPRAKYIVDPYWSGACAVTTKYVKNNPRTVLHVMKAIDRAVDYIRQNEQLAKKEILPKYTPLTPEIAERSGWYFTAKSTESIEMEKIQKIADQLFENGLIKKGVNVERMYISQRDLSN